MERVSVRVKATAILAIACGVVVACDRTGGTDRERLEREVQQRIPQVERATGLKFKTPPKVELRSKDQVRDFVLRKFEEDQPAAELKGEEQAYKLLGLIPDSMDLRKFLIDLLTEQIVGLYDPSTKVLYVVEGGAEEQRGIVVMHELVHALQDQYVNLDSIMRADGDADRTAAAQALIEGHATYEQIEMTLGGRGSIAAGLPGGWTRVREMIRDNQAAAPVFAQAPVIIQEALLFPYLSGADFVHRLNEQRGDSANPLQSIPRSSEQLLHTAAFFGAEPDVPTRVVLPPPTGGTKVHESNLGEFGTRIFLYEHTANFTASTQAAAGWDGDRYVVVQTPKGNAIAWLTVWDNAVEAAEFSQQLEAMVRRRYSAGSAETTGDVRRWRAQGRALVVSPGEVAGRTTVLFVDAPEGVDTGLLDLSKVRLEPAP